MLVGGDQHAVQAAHLAVGVDLDRHGLAHRPPEVLGPAERALDAGAAHLEQVRPEIVEGVERGWMRSDAAVIASRSTPPSRSTMTRRVRARPEP